MITEATILFAAGGALAVLGVWLSIDANRAYLRATEVFRTSTAMNRDTVTALAQLRAEHAQAGAAYDLPAAPVSSLGHD